MSDTYPESTKDLKVSSRDILGITISKLLSWTCWLREFPESYWLSHIPFQP